MSYLMVHLTIGYKLLNRCPDIKDKGAFLLGTVSPDAISFRPGCKRSDKEKTHFYVGDEGWGRYTNHEELENNFIISIKKYVGTVDKDFLFGYTSHVITDIEHGRQFWTPTRLTGDDDYINAYIRDCGEIDSILLADIENVDELWTVLENANKHCLPDIYTVEDNASMLNKMKTELYYNRPIDPEYAPRVLTMPRMLQFMDEVVGKVIGYK